MKDQLPAIDYEALDAQGRVVTTIIAPDVVAATNALEARGFDITAIADLRVKGSTASAVAAYLGDWPEVRRDV